MKTIGIRADSREQGEWVLETLKTAVEKQRVALEDIALVAHEEGGKVTLQQTQDKGLFKHFRDKGIDDDLMKRVGKVIPEGQSVVFALGADASIEAIAARVRELTGGSMETFVLTDGDEGLLREAGIELRAPDQTMVRAPLQ